MGPNQSTLSGQGQLPCLGILKPQPLLEECDLLRDEFDELPMGVSMEADKLHRLKYLLSLTRLPIDEGLRAEYKERVYLALKFRRDYEFLRGWLLTNGDGELENSTLEAVERQRKYFGPNDNILKCAIRRSLDARKNKAAGGKSSSGVIGTSQNQQDGEETSPPNTWRPSHSVPPSRRRRSSRWRKATPKVDSNLETVLEAPGEDDEAYEGEEEDQRQAYQ